MKIVILGANGMIGHTMLRVLSEDLMLETVGLVRRLESLRDCPANLVGKMHVGGDLMDLDCIIEFLSDLRPDVIINCAGVTKHVPDGMNPIRALALNAILPHRLAKLCLLSGARLIHISSDCVFSGKLGNYREDDQPDALDLYGSSKRFGEVSGPNLVTLRTSTIGHEISTRFGLLEWFLGQKTCVGYSNAIFSGLPTIEFSRIVRDLVIPNESLHGIYHVGANPISKFELLGLIAKSYKKEIEIIWDDSFRIDRSLNADRFRLATGYKPPAWPELIKLMYASK